MLLTVKSLIGNYKVISLLGKGGMGEVYLAEDENLERKVALKILNPQLTTDPQFLERFKQEAKIQANLIHSNIVTLHSFFIHHDQYIMVMQYAPGITLKDLIRRTGPIPEERAVKIFVNIVNGLLYAHSQGIIHRDIKPSNIMVDQNDNVKMMDFGIAKIVGNAGMTRTGSKMGTLYYMSPEQVKSLKDVDHRTDIYSLGVTLFEMLTGKVPFDSDTDSDFEIMSKIVNDELPNPRDIYPHISEKYVGLIEQMTAKNREERPSSFEDILSVNDIPQSKTKPSLNKLKSQSLSGIVEMVSVEGGTFQMGSNDGLKDEKPFHSVTLSSFYISKYPVSQKQWIDVMGDNPSHFREKKILERGFLGIGVKTELLDLPDNPVDSISWYDAVSFCNKLSIKEGLAPVYSINNNTSPSDWSMGTITADWDSNGYRLPTEAEWEYAARGGNKSEGYVYSGSNNIGDVAWYEGNSNSRTHPVGTKRANELGIYDMSGNVWEFCWDWYGNYSRSAKTNPRGPDSGNFAVLRGGSWYDIDIHFRVAVRYWLNLSNSYYVNIGFRIARTYN